MPEEASITIICEVATLPMARAMTVVNPRPFEVTAPDVVGGRNNRFVVHLETDLAAHVARGAVGESSDDNERLAAFQSNDDPFPRIDVETFHAGPVAIERRSLFEPSEQRSVGVGLGCHELAAAVRDFERGFL